MSRTPQGHGVKDHVDLEFLFGVSPFRTHSWLPGGWSNKRPSPRVTRSSRNLGGASGTVAQVWLPGGPVYMQVESPGWPHRVQASLPGVSSGHAPIALGLGDRW